MTDSLEKDLQAEITEQAEMQKASKSADGANQSNAVGFGRIGSDFSAAILVCCGIGWYADRFFGSQPWVLLSMTVIGFVVGIANVVRLTGGFEDRLGWHKQKQQQAKKENE